MYRFGPTRFSVLPKVAVGLISVRYVPDQDAGKLVDAFRRHVAHEFRKLRSANRIRVYVKNVALPWEADLESPYFSVAKNVLQRTWGVEPLLVREGGTMPLAKRLEKLLGACAIMVPMGQSSDQCHLANERLRMQNLLKG